MTVSHVAQKLQQVVTVPIGVVVRVNYHLGENLFSWRSLSRAGVVHFLKDRDGMLWI